MAFKKVGNLDPHGGPLLRKVIIDNSVAVDEMNCVKAIDASHLALCTAGDLVLGFVESIVDKNGVGVTDNGSGADFEGTYTAASDNETVAQVAAKVNVSKQALYSADPDVAIGTTTGSDSLGYHTDIADEDNTDEDTAALTTAQLAIWGIDPKDTGNQLVSIYESQMFGV